MLVVFFEPPQAASRAIRAKIGRNLAITTVGEYTRGKRSHTWLASVGITLFRSDQRILTLDSADSFGRRRTNGHSLIPVGVCTNVG